MCGGPEQSSNSYSEASVSLRNEGEDCNLGNGDFVSNLLELAASNDLEGFQHAVKKHSAKLNEAGRWYGRWNGTNTMVWEQRTPAMIASLFGSVEVLKCILSSDDHHKEINKKCGSDSSSALHCAAAGGSARAIETVILLLRAGADLNSVDAHGRKPVDLIAPFPKLLHVQESLKGLLEVNDLVQLHSPMEGLDKQHQSAPLLLEDEKMADDCKTEGLLGDPVSNSLSTSSEGSPFTSPLLSPSSKLLNMVSGKEAELRREKAREYFVDPSIPDIKNSLYTTDEFRMFSFKIRPCSRAYSHDWTECPFVHPGENARRRDPRRFHYSCVPCPEFRKGSCKRVDLCEYAHGVFECWLHPAQYRTRLCKDGSDCTRRVCFFAHTNDELRPLYTSSGSAIPSSRTSSLDLLNLSPPLCPGSPLSSLMMNSFSSSSAQGNHTTPPMSPSSSPANSLVGVGWSPSNVPSLHLPGANLQASRLRSALNARDISLEDYGRALDFDASVNEISSLSPRVLSAQARINAAISASSSSRYRNLGLTVSPTGLEEFSPSDFLSPPRSLLRDTSLISHLEGQLQSHKLSSLPGHIQGNLGSSGFSSVPDQYLQLQTVASETQMQGSPCSNSCKQMPAYSLGSLGRMQTCFKLDAGMQTGLPGQLTSSGLDACHGTSLPPSVVATRAAFAQQDKRSHSSKDLGAGYSLSDWGSPSGKPGWGSPSGKPEWRVEGEELLKFQKSVSFGFRGTDEPDLSWVQMLVKEGPIDGDKGIGHMSMDDESINQLREPVKHLSPGSWMENIQLDEVVTR